MMSMHAVSDEVDVNVLTTKTRQLAEQGYTIYRGLSDLLPASLRAFRPDAIAVGRTPNYVIEVVRDDARHPEKLKRLSEEVEAFPEWKLLVLYDRGTRARILAEATPAQIDMALESARNVLHVGETSAAFLLAWGVFEALARLLKPSEFQHPQTPGRIIQILTAGGELNAKDETLLRSLASLRNSIIHGELARTVDAADVSAFLRVLEDLRLRLDHEEVAVP